ncbi:DUF169 domain-containing protein [Desulfocastanea catecholica]
MSTSWKHSLDDFLAAAGLSEMPMGMYFTDTEPNSALSPNPLPLPTRQNEIDNRVDWPTVFGNFSCAIGHIWRARKKKTAAYFSAERYGCLGCAFWMGFNKPQLETIIHYVSTGIPNHMEGEHYCDSPDRLRHIFENLDPEPAPGKFCVFKPLNQFTDEEQPLFIVVFDRPEAIAGMHQLAAFVTGDPLCVVSPWSAACGSMVAWPMYFQARGENRAVLGGWDISARKFFKGDEVTLTVPLAMFEQMVARYRESFLMKKSWTTVKKKIERSRKVWGESTAVNPE